MALDILDISAGLFSAGFTVFFLTALVFSLIELLGKLYATFRILIRDDLSSEQRVIYLLLSWFVPLGWLIYFVLGTERTRDLFSDVEMF